MIRTDRSRIEALEHCARRRWWGWEYGGRGVERDTLSMPLLTGSAVHEVIEAFVDGFGKTGVDTLDQILVEIITEYQERVAPFVDADETGGVARQVEEQYDLVEALSRAWVAVRWPEMRRTYEVVAIEREYEARFEVDGEEVVLMTRPDFVLRRRSDGEVFVRNLKTVSDANDTWIEQWRYDMQTLSETLAVEQATGLTAGGVEIEGLIKGYREEYPKGSGLYQHRNPLVWCWYRAGDGLSTGDEFAARYEWNCAEPHTTDGGRQCPGGRGHRLGPGWRKVRVSEKYHGGIRKWINVLLGSDAEVVERVIKPVPVILRSPWEVERWIRQALTREVRTGAAARLVRQEQGTEMGTDLLDRWFPMSSAHGNCLRPSKCAFTEMCWGTAEGDPLGAGFRWRTPNHPGERGGEHAGGQLSAGADVKSVDTDAGGDV